MDQQKVEALATRIVGDMAASFSMALGHIGDRLGLFRAMKGAGPVASAQLAAKTALNERYVREWLKAMAASEYLDYDPTSDTYVMTAEQAGAYKPDPRPYRAALAAIGMDAKRVLFVAGSAHDVGGAKRAGMDVYWANRLGAPLPDDAAPLVHAPDLGKLAALLDG